MLPKDRKAKSQSSRIDVYDNFRGILVIGMIIYHIRANFWANFHPDPLWDWVPIGFMLGIGITSAAFLTHKPQKLLSLSRQLVAIFLVLNLSKLVDVPQGESFVKFLEWFFQAFIPALVTGDQTVLSFEILWIMAIFLALWRRIWPRLKQKFATKKFTTQILWIPVLALCGMEFAHIYYFNLTFLIRGLTGALLGLTYFAPQNIQKLPVLSTGIEALIVTTLCLWYLDHSSYGVSVVTLLHTVSFFVVINALWGPKLLARVGRYSLYIYVIHIIVIKAVELVFFR